MIVHSAADATIPTHSTHRLLIIGSSTLIKYDEEEYKEDMEPACQGRDVPGKKKWSRTGMKIMWLRFTYAAQHRRLAWRH